MATASDDFNRANGPLGSNWVAMNGFPADITSNQVAGIGSTQSPVYWAEATTNFTDDHSSQVEARAFTAGSAFAYALVRCSGIDATANRYVLRTDGTTTTIRKVINGTDTQLLDCGTGASVGDIIKLKIIGNTLTAYKNGSQIGTVASGGEITTGQPGFSVFDAGAIDNWSASDEVADPTGGISFVINNLRPNAFAPGSARPR